MKKYFLLFVAFFRASLTADLEFRLNFATRIITDIFWYLAQIFSFELLYNFTDQIGSWNREEMRVFLGILFVVDAIYMILFSTNLDNFSENVSKGSLDLLLAKPVNSQFMISLQRTSTAHLGNLLLASIWLGWSLWNINQFEWWRLLWLFIVIPSGTIIIYGLRFFFSAMAIVFTRADNIQYLWYHIYKLGIRPDNIYFPYLKYLVLSAIPVGLVASVPSRLVLGSASPWLALWGVIVSGLVLFFSNRFWKFALTKYTSASS